MIDFEGKHIGLFGGTFDPFHNAHRQLIVSALEQLPLDVVLVMPLGQAPHKKRRISLAAHRFEMARLGIDGLSRVVVSDDEIRTPGVDYTYETILRLKEQHCPAAITVLVGSDVLLSIDSWYRVKDLMGEISLAVVRRGDDDIKVLESKAEESAARYGAKIVFFDMPPSMLASSDLRRIHENQGDFREKCPDSVVTFIERHRLYSLSPVYSMVDDDDWERLVALEGWSWRFISQERRVHSASVAQYAGKLASLYEVDIWKAIAAGLLHDMAKEFPLEEQKELARQYLDDETLFSTLSDDLMHGPAAAKFISKTCGKCEVEFLDAIAFHSTGRGDMSVLGQILFLADKIAFDRTFRRLDAIRSLAEDGNLDDAMKLCLEEIFSALKYSGVKVNSLSLDAYRKYAGGASS